MTVSEKNNDLSRARDLISDYLEVLDAHILRESPKWTTAIVTVETPNGSRSLRFYRWQKRDGEWKKKSSFNVNRKDDWEEIKEEADAMSEKLW